MEYMSDSTFSILDVNNYNKQLEKKQQKKYAMSYFRITNEGVANCK